MIQDWKKGDKILITANTGAGKTHFIMNTLYNRCKDKGYKLLILSNRSILKQQLEALYGEQVKDVVRIWTYQYFSQRLKGNNFLNEYRIIVSDECHYFFADSTFAEETDIPLKYLTQKMANTAVIFLSATSEILKSYLDKDNQLNFTYSFTRPYKFNECFYWNDLEVVKKFLIEIPPNEKAIYFCKSIKTAYDLHNEFPLNSSFICSQSDNTSKYSSLADVDTIEQIRNTQRFEKQILFTTSVLENGINLHDPKLKHIICDLYDFDTIIQCIGRKRISDDNNLPNIYIKQLRQCHIQTYSNEIHKKLKPLECFKKNFKEFEIRYGRKSKHGLLYTVCADENEKLSKWEINVAKETKYNYDIELAEKINKSNTKFGHLIELCNRMNIDFSEFKDMELYYTKITLQDRLNQYLNIELYEKDKTQFIELLKKDVLKPLYGGYKCETVNRYFDDVELPYKIVSCKQGNKMNIMYGKRCWILKLKVS